MHRSREKEIMKERNAFYGGRDRLRSLHFNMTGSSHSSSSVDVAAPRPAVAAGVFCSSLQKPMTHTRPSSPHDFPWNRLDQIVCGWDCQLGTGLRLRCKVRPTPPPPPPHAPPFPASVHCPLRYVPPPSVQQRFAFLDYEAKQFEAVPHPPVRAMAYAGGMGMFGF